MLAVFPSFYHWTEHHLALVTKTPFVHYFFSAETLSRAYHALLDERGDEAYWYRPRTPQFADWERSYSINGTTAARFRSMVRAVGFDVVLHCRLAIGETGRIRQRHAAVAWAVPLFRSLSRWPVLEEVFCHRIVRILRKPVS